MEQDISGEEKIDGGLAQLGERLPCKQEVSGSIPLISTRLKEKERVSGSNRHGFSTERRSRESPPTFLEVNEQLRDSESYLLLQRLRLANQKQLDNLTKWISS